MKNEKRSVLIVDDEINIRELIKDNLEEENYRVFTANDGLSAIEMVKKNDPDLVILDIMMPEMDGWEVCKTIRDRGDEIKILMLTAKSSSRHRMIGESILKADRYMTKPFDVEELISEIRRLLEDRE
ncbi:MAG: response regulator [Candidatus Delongbacteria bacterium]